jgi:hypothetical protein
MEPTRSGGVGLVSQTSTSSNSIVISGIFWEHDVDGDFEDEVCSKWGRVVTPRFPIFPINVIYV